MTYVASYLTLTNGEYKCTYTKEQLETFGRWDLKFAVANNVNDGLISGKVWTHVNKALINMGREKTINLISTPFVWDDLEATIDPDVIIEGFETNVTVYASSHRSYTYERF